MVFFPWLFVAFAFGWCFGRLLLNRWWKRELDKLEKSWNEYIAKTNANDKKMLDLIREAQSVVRLTKD